MNRRDALKNIGLSLSYTAMAPSALSILQGCTTEKKKWIPLFFNIEEATIVKTIIDLILPKTEATPGAIDVNVPEFIDLLAYKSYIYEEQLKFREGITAIINELTPENNPEFKISNLTPEDYHTILSKYLKAPKEKQTQFSIEEKLVFDALSDLRGKAIWAYRTSQEIGENVMAYDPIPGIQKGCISLDEATNGKLWSL